MSRVTTTTWAPSAERDVGRIFTYFEQHSVVGARTMVRRIVRAVGLVAKQPEIGRVAEDIEPVGRFRSVVAAPYRVIYRFDEGEVYVLRVWDTRRDPASLQVLDDPADENESEP